jgi:CheY-like chemotaxis protein
MIQSTRILIVDDELPPIMHDLRTMGFQLTHISDLTPQSAEDVEKGRYDVVLLDFGGVGSRFGPDEGLAALRHIRNINPAIIVISYTSRALGAKHADFYTLADRILDKDAGLTGTREIIVAAIRQSFTPDHLWDGVLAKLNATHNAADKAQWQHLFEGARRSEHGRQKLRNSVLARAASGPARELLGRLLDRLFLAF